VIYNKTCQVSENLAGLMVKVSGKNCFTSGICYNACKAPQKHGRPRPAAA